MGTTWGPSGADRTQVGPMLAPWTLLSGKFSWLDTASLWDKCHLLLLSRILRLFKNATFIQIRCGIETNGYAILSNEHINRSSQIHWAKQHTHFSFLFFCVILHPTENNHRWPYTQPNQIAYNLAAHPRAAHNSAARWCAGSIVYVIRMDNPLRNLTSQTTM